MFGKYFEKLKGIYNSKGLIYKKAENSVLGNSKDIEDKFNGILGKGKNSFSLVELLTVIAIIGVLAGVLAVSIQSARKRAKIRVAQHEIKQLEQALEIYAQGWGVYAPEDSSDSLVAMTHKPISSLESTLPSNVKRGGPFINLPDYKKLDPPTDNSQIDPWNNAYRYRYPSNQEDVSPIGIDSGLQYNIWSIGPDGINDIYKSGIQSDDIRNWE